MIKLLIGLIAVDLGLLTIAVTARFVVWILNERKEQKNYGSLSSRERSC